MEQQFEQLKAHFVDMDSKSAELVILSQTSSDKHTKNAKGNEVWQLLYIIVNVIDYILSALQSVQKLNGEELEGWKRRQSKQTLGPQTLQPDRSLKTIEAKY